MADKVRQIVIHPDAPSREFWDDFRSGYKSTSEAFKNLISLSQKKPVTVEKTVEVEKEVIPDNCIQLSDQALAVLANHIEPDVEISETLIVALNRLETLEKLQEEESTTQVDPEVEKVDVEVEKVDEIPANSTPELTDDQAIVEISKPTQSLIAFTRQNLDKMEILHSDDDGVFLNRLINLSIVHFIRHELPRPFRLFRNQQKGIQ